MKIKNVYSLNDAINCEMETTNVFIIANERKKKDGGIGRYYTIFPSYKSFTKRRDKYLNCHELLVDHKNNNRY
jgi:hypothetical protein